MLSLPMFLLAAADIATRAATWSASPSAATLFGEDAPVTLGASVAAAVGLPRAFGHVVSATVTPLWL